MTCNLTWTILPVTTPRGAGVVPPHGLRAPTVRLT